MDANQDLQRLSWVRYAIISVMGPHAGESENQIFVRKRADILKVGLTFWLIRSFKAKPGMVQKICNAARENRERAYCYFIEASSNSGSSPTNTADLACRFSIDRTKWRDFPGGLSPVTGKIDGGAYALVFDKLEMIQGNIDLWDFADFFDTTQPIRIQQGGSTLCAVRKYTGNHPKKRMKSNIRQLIAVARFAEPFGVWLR